MGSVRIAFFSCLLVAPLGARAQELWMFGSPNISYGVFRTVPEKNNPLNTFEEKIGYMEVKKTASTYGGKSCTLYSSTAKYSPKPIGRNLLPPPTTRRYDMWVADDGTPLRIYMQHNDLYRQIITDAIFKADGIEMTITEGGKSRKTTLYPSEGLKAFRNPILDLMANADKDRTWVNFSCLEAATAGIAKYKAIVTGKFSGEIAGNKVEGRMIEIDGAGPNDRYTFYVSKEGQLLQVDIADDLKVHAQSFPAIIRKGGGG